MNNLFENAKVGDEVYFLKGYMAEPKAAFISKLTKTQVEFDLSDGKLERASRETGKVHGYVEVRIKPMTPELRESIERWHLMADINAIGCRLAVEGRDTRGFSLQQLSDISIKLTEALRMYEAARAPKEE